MNEISHPSPNFKERPGGHNDISAIIIHTTGGKAAGSIAWLCDSASGVSAHVVIDVDGNVYRLVDDRNEAYHAGVSTLFGRDYCNGFSLGVELEREETAAGDYPYAQLMAAAQWTAEKCKQYSIPINRVVGHKDIAMPPGRKIDPIGPFPWADWLLEVASRIGQ